MADKLYLLYDPDSGESNWGGSDVRIRRTIASTITFDNNGGGLVTLSGDTGGLTIQGGTAASNNLTLASTSNATKGFVYMGDDLTVTYDQTNHDLIIANFSGGVASTNTRFETMSDGAGGWVCTVYDAANNPFFNGQRALGTHTTPGGVVNGTTLMTFGGTGHNGTSLLTASRASVRMFSTETWTVTANGTRLGFFTTPNTTATAAERLRVGNDGQIAVMISTVAFDASFPMHLRNTVDPVAYVVDAYGTGIRALHIGRMARGSVAVPTASQTDDVLAGFSGRGYGATAFSTDDRGVIHVHASENWTDTAQGTYIAVHVTASGGTTLTESWRFDQNGDLVMETNANLYPNTDSQGNIGTAAKRFATMVSNQFNVYAATSDANPTTQITTASIVMGAGGASAPDCRMRRTAATTITFDNNSTGGVDIVPATTNTGHLGTDTLKWNRVRALSVVTGDLEMRDEEKGVHYRLVEEVDGIYVFDEIKKKKFKMMLQEIPN